MNKKTADLIKIENGVAYIRMIKHGCTILVDEGDLDLVKDYGWCGLKNHINRGDHKIRYAVSRRFEGRHTTVLMHRLIMGLAHENGVSSKRQVDHINGNGLDNRKCNLRIVTQSQNNHNMMRGTHGKYPCVRWNNGTGKFIAWIKINNKRHILGEDFETPDDATLAYHNARINIINTGKI